MPIHNYALDYMRGAAWREQRDEVTRQREARDAMAQGTAQALNNSMQEVAPYQGTDTADPEFGVAAQMAAGPVPQAYRGNAAGMQTVTGQRDTPDMGRFYRQAINLAGQHAPEQVYGLVGDYQGILSKQQEQQRDDERWKAEFGLDQQRVESDAGYRTGQLDLQRQEFEAEQQEQQRSTVSDGLNRLYSLIPDEPGKPGELIDEATIWVNRYGDAWAREAGLEPHRRLVGFQWGADGRGFVPIIANQKTGTVGPMTVNGTADAEDRVLAFNKRALRAMGAPTASGRENLSSDYNTAEAMVSAGHANDFDEAWERIRRARTDPAKEATTIAKELAEQQRDAHILPGHEQYQTFEQLIEQARAAVQQINGNAGEQPAGGRTDSVLDALRQRYGEPGQGDRPQAAAPASWMGLGNASAAPGAGWLQPAEPSPAATAAREQRSSALSESAAKQAFGEVQALVERAGANMTASMARAQIKRLETIRETVPANDRYRLAKLLQSLNRIANQ